MVDSCNYTSNILHYIVSDEGPINDNDMQRIWKEAIMATYKMLLMYCTRGNWEKSPPQSGWPISKPDM